MIKKIFFKSGFSFTSLAVLFFLLLSITAAQSCQKQIGVPRAADPGVQHVVLDKQSASLMTGETVVLNLSLEDGGKFLKKFDFSVSDPQLATVSKSSAYSVQVRALRKGTAVVKFVSDDQELSCTINIDELPSDHITRILAIGNSFSEDALETYLHPIATAAGDSVIIANLYIGGSSLEDHLNNAKGNKAVYSYRKIGKNGVKVTRDNVSIEEAVSDERWDYISFQQVSQLSGRFDTYQNTLPGLVQYVKERVFYSKTKFVLHQTWAYAQNSTHDGFANYNRDQLTMYQAIADATQQAAALIHADLVVPAGSAIQNGRTSFWADNFCRDGYHLNLNVGRYLAACTWYEALFKKPVIGNAFNPHSFMLSPAEMEMAQHAAHAAVQQPYQVTEMTGFKTIAFSDFTTPVFLDIAQQVPAAGWNGISSPLAGTTVPFLRDRLGNLTRATATVTERFNNINSNGELNTTTPFEMPNSVSQNSYFGNPKAEFGGLTVPRSVIRISDLDPAQSYNLCFFGSRGGTPEGRQTKYISKGQNEVTAYLLTGSNRANIACTNGVKPDPEGNIFITVTAGESNDNATGFYYLNAVRISR